VLDDALLRISPRKHESRPGERAQHDALTVALTAVGPQAGSEVDDGDLAERLVRIPDLTRAVRRAPMEIERRTLDASDVQIACDKVQNRHVGATSASSTR